MPFSPPTVSGKVCRDTTSASPQQKVWIFRAVTLPAAGLSQSTTVTISSKVCRGSGSSAGEAFLKYGILFPPFLGYSATDTLAVALVEVASVATGSVYDTLAAAIAESPTLYTSAKKSATDTIAAALAEVNTLAITNPAAAGSVPMTPLDCLEGPGGIPGGGGGTFGNSVF